MMGRRDTADAATARALFGSRPRLCKEPPSHLFVGQSHAAPLTDILPMRKNPNSSCWGLTLRRLQKELTFIPDLALD
jgi:hypothetical protein